MAFNNRKNKRNEHNNSSLGTNSRDPNYTDPQSDPIHKIFVNGSDVTSILCKKVHADLSKEEIKKILSEHT